MSFVLQENVPLAPLTTLGIGGPARFFVEGTDETAVREALHFAKRKKLPLLVLGGGSNVVVADEGFPGVVVRIAIPGRELLTPLSSKPGVVAYRLGAGVDWDSFVAFSVGQNLAGIECLSGIPGSVGGTPVQNVGAYGQEVSSVIRSVRVFDRREEKIRELDNAACGFSYRQSIFNSTERECHIVLAVTFALRKDGAPTLRYTDVERYFQSSPLKPSLGDLRQAILAIRRKKGMVLAPKDPDSRSVGSFFKNPVVSEAFYRELALRFPGQPIPSYPVADRSAFSATAPSKVKLAAAWLIEQAGFSRGYPAAAQPHSRVGISSKHTLALINRGGATAAELLDLVRDIQSKVREEFHIELQPEPVFVGFPNRRCPSEFP